MNTNNKKAIELLHELRDSVFEVTNSDLSRVIDLLQDNEDTEVEDIAVQENTCLCKEDNCPNCEYVGCKHVKPSSKVEKLKELQRRFSTNLDYGAQWADLVKILNVLIEDEE